MPRSATRHGWPSSTRWIAGRCLAGRVRRAASGPADQPRRPPREGAGGGRAARADPVRRATVAAPICAWTDALAVARHAVRARAWRGWCSCARTTRPAPSWPPRSGRDAADSRPRPPAPSPADRVHPRAVPVARRHGLTVDPAGTAHVADVVRRATCHRRVRQRPRTPAGRARPRLHWSVPDPRRATPTPRSRPPSPTSPTASTGSCPPSRPPAGDRQHPEEPP